MTPQPTRVSQREPNNTRVLPAVVQHPDPRRWICPDRNVHTDALCYKLRPRRARRRELSFDCLSQRQPANRSWPQAQKLMYFLLCGLLFFCQSVQASLHGSSILERELVFDRRPAPKPRMGLHARQDDSSSSPAATTTFSSIDAPSSTSSISESEIQTASSVPTSLPRPFDSSLGNNFTEPSCPQFFNDFLSNDTFQECLPFSLLLKVSSRSFLILPLPETMTNSRNTDIQLFFHSSPISFISYPRPRRNMPPPLIPNLQHPNVHPRHPTLEQSLRQGSRARKPAGNTSVRRLPQLRHPLRRLVPHLCIDGKLLLRRRRLQHVRAHLVAHLLRAAWSDVDPCYSARLHALSPGHDGYLCSGRWRQEIRVQRRLCAGGASSRSNVRAWLRSTRPSFE